MGGFAGQPVRAVAAGLSVLVHAGFTLVIALAPTPELDPSAGGLDAEARGSLLILDDPAAADPPPPPPPAEITATDPPVPSPEPEMKPLTLGIEGSSQKTENWLGSDEPTPHSAAPSTVNQPALDPNAGSPSPGGAPGSPGAPSPDASKPTPATPAPNPDALVRTDRPVPPAAQRPPTSPTPGSPAALAVPAPSLDPGPDAPALDPTQPAVPKPTDNRDRPERDGAPDGVDGPVPERVGDGGPRDQAPGPDAPPDPPDPLDVRPDAPDLLVGPPIPEEVLEALAAPARTEPESSPQDASSPAVAGADEAPGLPGRPGENPGQISEKESDAASIEQMLTVRPGMPAAAEGLEIITRRPNFTRLTRVTAAPGNPIVRIFFKRTGTVGRVELLRSSGSDDVDGPVLNAVYNWRAKGKALDDLPNRPTAGITLTVTIVLR
jgi:hypothetical protein